MDAETRSLFELSPEEVVRQWDKQWQPVVNTKSPEFSVSLVEKAMRGYLKLYCFQSDSIFINPEHFLHGCLPKLVEILGKELKNYKGLKLWLNLAITFEKSTDDSKLTNAYFCSNRQECILESTALPQAVTNLFPQITHAIECFQRNGSNWIVARILRLDAHIARYSPLKGACHVTLPRTLTCKKAIVNVQNTDNQCFKWSVLAALHPAKYNICRVTKYIPYSEELSFNGIEFPVSLQDIPIFEHQNGLSINVYGYETSLYPMYISKMAGKHIDLLYYQNHYCWVRNLDRLLSSQNKHNGKKYFCHMCLFPFYQQEALNNHTIRCETENPSRIEMPEDGQNALRFKSVQKMLRQVLVVYADFECLTEKIPSCSPCTSTSFTERYQLHTPCSYGFVTAQGCCNDTHFSPPEIFRGPRSAYHFLRRILEISHEYQSILNRSAQFLATPEQEIVFSDTTNCTICKTHLGTDDRVRDHCHVCGQFRGAAHNSCNQQYRLNGDLVVVFHNLRRYDSHLLMQEIGSVCNELKLSVHCVAKNMEDYITFFIRCCYGGRRYKIKFIDSCQFLQASLENLVGLLQPHDFHAMRANFNQQQIQLLLRKGVYPYDYIDRWARFEETCLPPQNEFYSRLSEEHISNDDYTHAESVWCTFNMKTLGQYHDLYLTTDVLLLGDVFENFRSLCLSNYGLDPCHYCTLPSFAWDACLKFTNVELELLVEPEMYSFFELGIRGGISTICHRYAKANNRYLPENFDPTKPTSYILYLDANNLYGWSMVNPLPHSNFRWLNNDEIDQLDVLSISEDSDVGYVLEVDLDYPEYLHTAHDSYPLAAEKMCIREELLSPYCRQLQTDLDKNTVIQEKLVPNLFPKSNYIVHYRNLQLYITLGLRLKRINRVIAFHQEPWLREYIVFNTEMRKSAESAFAKDLFKLLNNAVFGKTMENKRKRTDVKLPTKTSQFLKLVANPRYERSSIFSEDLVGVAMACKKVLLDKPIYAGFAVLELSKLLMYNFHYSYIVPKYSKAKLLFTDTDSLCYYIETHDVYSDMLQDSHLFDTSDYPPTSFLFSTENKKVLGKMKDETAGVPIEEFVGLRPKMYSLLCDGKAKKRAKGVKKGVVKKRLSHLQYKKVLFEKKETKNQMNIIRSQRHTIHSVCLNKISLSCYDDKRYILADGITSYAFGNATIPRQ